jgi:hypothetical protein
VAQGQEAGLGGARIPSIGRDVLNGALKVGDWDRRILRRYLLIRPVVDTVARELPPVVRPVGAETAVTVIDQQRPWTGGRQIGSSGGLISGSLLHNFNLDQFLSVVVQDGAP